MEKSKITVTSPLLPDLDDFHSLLKEIWDAKWITNNGSFHQKLETALAEYLKVPFVSLFTNGTLPLITALQAVDNGVYAICQDIALVETSSNLASIHCNPEKKTIDINSSQRSSIYSARLNMANTVAAAFELA